MLRIGQVKVGLDLAVLVALGEHGRGAPLRLELLQIRGARILSRSGVVGAGDAVSVEKDDLSNTTPNDQGDGVALAKVCDFLHESPASV